VLFQGGGESKRNQSATNPSQSQPPNPQPAPHPPTTPTRTQVVVRRGGKIEGPPGPIIVATRNDALDGIVDATPADRRKGGCEGRWVGGGVHGRLEAVWSA